MHNTSDLTTIIEWHDFDICKPPESGYYFAITASTIVTILPYDSEHQEFNFPKSIRCIFWAHKPENLTMLEEEAWSSGKKTIDGDT